MEQVKIFQEREKVIELRKKIDELEKEEKEALLKLQAECEHRIIVETPYEKTTFGNHWPMRICVYCGLEEEDKPFKKLVKKPLKTVSREEFYKLRELPELTFAAVPTALIGKN